MAQFPIKFRVYPESVHGFYFNVRIYRDQESMQKAAEYGGGKRKNFSNAAAVVRGLKRGRRTDRGIAWKKQLGTIYFYKDCVGTEVITHESTHAALRWAEEKKFNVVDRNGPDYIAGDACDNEERFCYALGKIAAQIASKCWAHKLYE